MPETSTTAPRGLTDSGNFEVIYAVSKDWHVPADLDLANFPGALEVSLLKRCAEHRRLATSWRDEKTFIECSKAAFEKQLQISDPEFYGRTIQQLKPSKPKTIWNWLKRYYVILITLVAVLSNFDSLRLGLYNLFRGPDAFVSPAKRKIISTVGSETEVDFTIQNRSGGPSPISIERPLTDPGDLQGIVFDGTPWQGELPPYGRDTMSIRFSASSPQKFTLTPTGTAKAGWARSRTPLEVIGGVEVEIWAAVDEAPIRNIQRLSDDRHLLNLTFQHGSPLAQILQYKLVLDISEDWIIPTPQNQLTDFKVSDRSGRTITVKWIAEATPQRPQKLPILIQRNTSAPDDAALDPETIIHRINVWQHNPDES